MSFIHHGKRGHPQIGIEEDLPGLTMNPYSDSTQQTTVNILDEDIQCILGFE